MVVLFVIATVLTFLIVDYFVQHRQAKLAPAAQPIKSLVSAGGDFFLPDGLFSSNGHLWNELFPQGALNVGIDPFLKNAAGKIDRVHLPQKGEAINKGDVLFVLEMKGKKISVRSPFSGMVEKTNSMIEEQLTSENIRDAWAVRLTPTNLAETVKSFRLGQEAKDWMKNELARFREFLASYSADPQLAAVMQDGGVPVTGSLLALDDEARKWFEHEFLAVEN